MELVDFSKFRLNKGNRDPKCHHLSIKVIKKLVICNHALVLSMNSYTKDVSGFYDPCFYDSHFPFLRHAAAGTAATLFV